MSESGMRAISVLASHETIRAIIRHDKQVKLLLNRMRQRDT